MTTSEQWRRIKSDPEKLKEHNARARESKRKRKEDHERYSEYLVRERERSKRYRETHSIVQIKKISINTILQLGITREEVDATQHLKRIVRYMSTDRKWTMRLEESGEKAFEELAGLIKDKDSIFKDVGFLKEYFRVEEK